MGDLREERLAVLRMVAAGTVSPEDALDLLSALQPGEQSGAGQVMAVAPDSGDEIILLRVHCEVDEKECDFTIPADAVGELPDLLPDGAGNRVPVRLLQRLGALAAVEGDDRLLHLEEDEFELTVTRLRSARRGRELHGRGAHVGFIRGR